MTAPLDRAQRDTLTDLLTDTLCDFDEAKTVAAREAARRQTIATLYALLEWFGAAWPLEQKGRAA